MIPELTEIGVTVLSPVFGDRLTVWLGGSTQTTMPFSQGGLRPQPNSELGPAGYFPSPTRVLEPEVP